VAEEPGVFTEDKSRRLVFRGSNIMGVRDHNARLVLTLIRQNGPLPKARIARLTGLSAQTVSVIVRSLEADGLLSRGEPVRGKVGQPSVPIALAPEGAFFLGLKIGRRSSELVLINFAGEVVTRTHLTYRFPTPSVILRFTEDSIDHLVGQLAAAEAERVVGLGVAMPFKIWDWAPAIGLADDAMDAWRDLDVRAAIEAICPYPVYLQNDASAACGAELVFGTGDRPGDFLYFYIGYFIGGGVVLGDKLFTGRTGNAGALGSMPVPAPDGRVVQLIEVASLSRLEAMMRERGQDAQSLWIAPDGWVVEDDLVAAWVDGAARGLAFAIAASVSVVDFEAVLIDGWLPAALRAHLVRETVAHLERLDLAGLIPPLVSEGSVGPDARVLGAASLPLTERFVVTFSGTIAES
jgi:predicted NBD/HSP70 family sugar kinase